MYFRLIELAPSASRTANGNNGVIDTMAEEHKWHESSDMGSVRVYATLGAVTGTTPNLNINVWGVPDGVADFHLLGQFTGIDTAFASESLVIVSASRYMRVSWVITGGSADFTFGVGVERF